MAPYPIIVSLDTLSVVGNHEIVFAFLCCHFQIHNAAAAGAKGVIVVNAANAPPVSMNCVGNECDLPSPDIPATLVQHGAGDVLISMATDGANASFATLNTHNFYFAIDAAGDLAETGWLLFPSLRFLTWQADWCVCKLFSK